jgi:pimeloyl-ACP methyl ester carboxylesterase
VLELRDGGAALVDLASAFRLPWAGGLRRWLERRALAKLRRRFTGPAAPWADAAPLHTLKAGRTRISHREAGPLRDPVPVLCLHDLGLTSAVFGALLASAPERARRALAPDLPGFGDSRRRVGTFEPGALAQQIDAWLDVLRIRRVDVVAQGWGERIAARLAPGRVRRLVALPAVTGPATATPAAIRAALPPALDREAREEIERSLETLGGRGAELLAREAHSSPLAARAAESWERLREPERLWMDLS